ncbi:two-component system sensor histidine kinase SapS [Enterococcus sp. HY326]|uniref:two-component system sensor histidine kinase SapS n=1 Tax=Enterococcus sp. HY326 TaxID=2971265 RepID=UPI0022400D15|nr:sensor histidine kinase [Enterococcus sp. HY326]
MSFWQYLKDRWLIIIGWLLFVVLTIFLMWLTPSLYVDWSIIGYLALLEGFLLLIFLGGYYLARRHWWRRLQMTEEAEDVLQEFFDDGQNNEEILVENYINHLLVEHQQTMQDLVEKQQDQKDYIDSWVHEIKVPLAAAGLILRSIEDDISDEKYLLLEDEIAQIDEYVEQVLYYARLDTFSKDYLIQEYSLKEIVQPVVRSQVNHFIQKNLKLEILGEDYQVLTDAKWLSYIFRQLLSNAIKYTPVNGEVQILMENTPDGIQLSVKDNGIGIPSEDVKRIFDKGFTGENGRRSEQHSTGLGLYLAYNLAEKLNVKLSVQSTVGQGTTMTLAFPKLRYYQEER